MKKNYTLTKLMIAVMAAATLFACEKPAATVETTVNVVEETVVEEPTPVVEEPEETEQDLPEVREPEAIIYDENGDIYVPQHVTLDDFYARVEHVEEEYDSVFKGYPDWLRDRYVSLLLERNCLYMDDEDIQTVYKDYLDDFGFNVYLEQNPDEIIKLKNNNNRIPLKEYFIDPVLAEEADAFETYYDSNGAQETYDLYSKKLEDVNLSDDKIYNSYMEITCNVLEPIIDENAGSIMDNYYSNCYGVSGGKMGLVASKATDNLNISYSKADYVSSHEMKQNTK